MPSPYDTNDLTNEFTMPHTRTTKRSVARLALSTSAVALLIAASVGVPSTVRAESPPLGAVERFGYRVDPASCDAFDDMRSLDGDTPVEARFVNGTDDVLTVGWISYEGALEVYGQVEPGEAYESSSFATHPWMFLDRNNECVGIVTVEAGVEEYVIGGSAPPAPAAPAAATAGSAVPGVVITADAKVDATVNYPLARLLAYSINDNVRAADGELTGFFVAPVDGAGGIVEGEENAPLLQLFATGEDTVMFATGLDTGTPRFLVPTEDGASFSDVPEESAYFFIRSPLEPSAAAQGFLSLESQAFPGQFLRHAGFRLRLDPIGADSDSLSRRDATFLLLADGAEIPVVQGDGAVETAQAQTTVTTTSETVSVSEEVLATTVTSFTTGEEVTLEAAVLTTLQESVASLDRSESVEVSFLVTFLTSLYQVEESVATSAVLTVFESQNITSVSETISVETVFEVVQARASAGGFYLAAHFAAMDAVDMGACGVETGGFGGFGDGFVPTNSHGDVHIFTPDGLAYDFQDGGEFTLVASRDGRFEVHTRQTVHSNDATVSSNTAVAVRLENSLVEIYSDVDGQRIYIDGERLDQLPRADFDLEDGGYVRYDGEGKSGPRYLIAWPGADGSDEFTVRVNLYEAFLNVGVAAPSGEYSGLIGNLDTNPLNDMLPRMGTELICPPADGPQLARFGDSWRVTTEETLLRAELDETLVAVATEIETGRRVGLENAALEVLEANFLTLEASERVEVSAIVSLLTSRYEVSEETALEVIVNVFEERGVATIEDTIEVATITEIVNVYEERREVRTLETIDVAVRARAQRICEANGITDQLALASCTLDVAATQDETFVESAETFQQVIVEVPREQRVSGSAVFDALAPEAVLPPERVVEIVGPPEVVPSFEELVTFVRNVEVREFSRTVTVSTSETLTRTVTEVTTGEELPLEAAVFETLETNFASMEATETVDLSLVVTILVSLYQVEEEVAQEAVIEVFADEGVTSATDTVEVAQITNEVSSYREQVEIVRTRDERVTETREEQVITTVTSDVTATVDLAACSEVEGLQTPAEVLERAPTAGGVAIFCATHARGQTVTYSLGRDLEGALEQAERTCPAEAESRIEDFGEIVIPCREIGRGEREFDFGGAVLGVGRDVEITLEERRIEKATLLELVENFSLVLNPAPAIGGQCPAGEVTAPLEGLTVTDGLLDFTGEGESDFQNLCAEISLEESEDDFYLQALCVNEDGSDARTSAISLLSTPAVEQLVASPECQPEEEVEPTVFAEDGLEAMFPDRGDFVLLRSEEAGVAIHARRDRWVSDKTESVFTAFLVQVGADALEFRATPEPIITINGTPLDDAPEAARLTETEDGALLDLPGGGQLRIGEDEGVAVFTITWAGNAFALELTLYQGSHIVPAIQVDTDFAYEGLARFTADWILDAGSAGFSMPLGGDPTCECASEGADVAGVPVDVAPPAETSFPAGGLGTNVERPPTMD